LKVLKLLVESCRRLLNPTVKLPPPNGSSCVPPTLNVV
jgi:hypothetical protein